MKSLIILTIIALASAAQLPSNSYLPQTPGSGQRPGSYPSNQGPFQGGSQHNGGQFQGGSGDTGNRRPQQEQEKNAEILKQDQDINENGFHYSYETSNGIRAEEAGNEKQTQGGFSYQGDDGNTYSIVFTAGEGGFRPQGDHLPIPPPTPEAILQALEQNAKDEAAGIFDDGKYHPDANEGVGNGNGHGNGHGQSNGYLSGHGPSQRPSFKPGHGSSATGNGNGGFNSNTGYRY